MVQREIQDIRVYFYALQDVVGLGVGLGFQILGLWVRKPTVSGLGKTMTGFLLLIGIGFVAERRSILPSAHPLLRFGRSHVLIDLLRILDIAFPFFDGGQGRTQIRRLVLPFPFPFIVVALGLSPSVVLNRLLVIRRGQFKLLFVWVFRMVCRLLLTVYGGSPIRVYAWGSAVVADWFCVALFGRFRWTGLMDLFRFPAQDDLSSLAQVLELLLRASLRDRLASLGQ